MYTLSQFHFLHNLYEVYLLMNFVHNIIATETQEHTNKFVVRKVMVQPHQNATESCTRMIMLCRGDASESRKLPFSAPK